MHYRFIRQNTRMFIIYLLSTAAKSYKFCNQFYYETHSSYSANTEEHKTQMSSVVFFASFFG